MLHGRFHLGWEKSLVQSMSGRCLIISGSQVRAPVRPSLHLKITGQPNARPGQFTDLYSVWSSAYKCIPIFARERSCPMDIGLVGTGPMGLAIGKSLLRELAPQGHNITVYNRTVEKAGPLVEAGARLAKTLEQAAAGDVVLSIVADDAAIAALTFSDNGIISGPEGRRSPRRYEHGDRRNGGKSCRRA